MYLIAKYLSNYSKFLRIKLLRLNLRVISAVITVFVIQELSDCWKFLRISQTSAIKCENNFSSLSQYNYHLNTLLIVVLTCTLRLPIIYKGPTFMICPEPHQFSRQACVLYYAAQLPQFLIALSIFNLHNARIPGLLGGICSWELNFQQMTHAQEIKSITKMCQPKSGHEITILTLLLVALLLF